MKEIQVGHTFDIQFKMNIVNDKLVYKDEKTKSKGYEIKGGSSKLKTPILDVSSKIGVSKKKFSENEREDLTYSTVVLIWG